MGKKQTSISIDEGVYNDAFKIHRFYDFKDFSDLVEALLRDWVKVHKIGDLK